MVLRIPESSFGLLYRITCMTIYPLIQHNSQAANTISNNSVTISIHLAGNTNDSNTPTLNAKPKRQGSHLAARIRISPSPYLRVFRRVQYQHMSTNQNGAKKETGDRP